MNSNDRTISKNYINRRKMESFFECYEVIISVKAWSNLSLSPYWIWPWPKLSTHNTQRRIPYCLPVIKEEITGTQKRNLSKLKTVYNTNFDCFWLIWGVGILSISTHKFIDVIVDFRASFIGWICGMVSRKQIHVELIIPSQCLS